MAGLSRHGAFSVLTNTILGPGLLGLPWAVSQCGFALGLILLILCACIGFLGMHFLAASAMLVTPTLQDSDVLSLSAMCRHVSSPVLHAAFEVGLVIACSGALITSLIIIGDSLEPLQLLSRQHWILVVFCCVAFPLSCFKQIKFLRFSSYLSLAMILYIVGLVLAYAATGGFPEEEVGPLELFRWDNGMAILQSLPVFTFCFCGHMNIIPITKELADVNLIRLDAVMLFALVVAGSIYTAVSAGAYISFGNATPQDLLSKYNYCPAVIIARIGMTVVCTAFYPLLVQPIRGTLSGWVDMCLQRYLGSRRAPQDTSVEKVVSLQRQSKEADPLSASTSAASSSQPASAADGNSHASGAGPARHESIVRFPMVRRRQSVEIMQQVAGSDRPVAIHWVLTLLVGGVALAVALSTTSLGKVFSLSGATGFALLCNICPSVLYLRLTAPTSAHMRASTAPLAAAAADGEPRDSGGQSMLAMRALATCLLGLGLLSMPFCIAANLITK